MSVSCVSCVYIFIGIFFLFHIPTNYLNKPPNDAAAARKNLSILHKMMNADSEEPAKERERERERRGRKMEGAKRKEREREERRRRREGEKEGKRERERKRESKREFGTSSG